MTILEAKADTLEGRCQWRAAADAWGCAIKAAEAEGHDATIMRARKSACEYMCKGVVR